METRTLQLSPTVALVLRVPDDAVVLALVRYMFVANTDPEAALPQLELAASLIESPIDTEAVARVRAMTKPAQRAEVAAASDANLWLRVLIQRHGKDLLTRMLYVLFDVPMPPRYTQPKVQRGRPR